MHDGMARRARFGLLARPKFFRRHPRFFRRATRLRDRCDEIRAPPLRKARPGVGQRLATALAGRQRFIEPSDVPLNSLSRAPISRKRQRIDDRIPISDLGMHRICSKLFDRLPQRVPVIKHDASRRQLGKQTKTHPVSEEKQIGRAHV